jgi:hypothetical protein
MDPHPQQPTAKPPSNLRKLKRNTDATASELREFLAEMRGKSPREMLGAVATSDLGKSLVQASIGVAVAIAIFTVVPFAFGKMFAKDDPAGAPPASATAESGAGAGSDARSTPPEPALDPDAKSPKAIDALGIGESKESPLTVNPLEDAGDDILKDLE